MDDNSIIKKMPQAILNWYDFEPDKKILLLCKNDTLSEFFINKGFDITNASENECYDSKFQEKFHRKFDYIIAIETPEESATPKEFLLSLKNLITQTGRLFLGVNNRFGIRYFCGDKDPYTNRVFDGIEGYRNCIAKSQKFKYCYSKSEIEELLDDTGWLHHTAFAVLPDLIAPQMIFREGFRIDESLSIRCFPQYNSPDTVFTEEEFLYNDLIKNDMFYQMANVYLFDCPVDGVFIQEQQITTSIDRGSENALATVIYEDRVEKKGICRDLTSKFKRLIENTTDLEERGIQVVKGSLKSNKYVMEREHAKLGNVFLYELLQNDSEKFIQKMDLFVSLIKKSSDEIEEEYNRDEVGVLVKNGYVDMVPLNSFWAGETFLFFDQEFVIENYPINAIIYRSICIVYESDPRRNTIVPIDFFWKRYELEKYITKLQKLAGDFTNALRHQNDLREYNQRRLRNSAITCKNKCRMNFSEPEYEQLFFNPIAGTQGKKVFIFGSGKYATKFYEMYHNDIQIEAVLDNNDIKRGTDFYDIKIKSPDILKSMDVQTFKVIICMRNYSEVLAQLRSFGVKNVSIYDMNKVYPGRQEMVLPHQSDKKYHIGYVAGVFDLYHYGHLRMFQRAKEQCDYLIVGVVSDEGVRVFKKTTPFVPFEERIEMVKSCKYVDEAVEIPLINRSTREAFEKYHFDVQFSGSDYENDIGWLQQKAFLESHGATMVFLKYTEQTSSTKLKTLIDKALL